MSICNVLKNQSVPMAAMAALCTTGFISSVQAQGEAPNLAYVTDASGAPGGIAGVSFAEDFETFTLGVGCGQNGWACVAPGTWDVVNSGVTGFGQRTARSTASGTAAAAQDIRSPVFPLEQGIIQADIIINNTGSLFQFNSLNTLAGAGFFNTRLNFEASGVINALQIVGVPPCTTGTFAATTGTWTPGVKMRIGIEVLSGNILRVYKDGVQIFTGHDIAQFCAAGDPDIGINQVRNFDSNVGTTSTMDVDNISSVSGNPCLLPLPPCPQDVAPNGQVDVQDLLVVINTWGQTGPPRPQGDCAPPPAGDCTVSVTDLLAVINRWGPCPAITGACCTNGVCTEVTEADCTSGGGTYQGDGTLCSDVDCPVPQTNDECVNASVVTCGQTITLTSAQLESYTTVAGDPVTTCEIASGGPFLKDRSAWYKLTTAANQTGLALSACTSQPNTIDTILSVFDACGGQELACDDDFCTAPAFGASEIACFNVLPSTEYIILLQRYQGGGTGTVNIVIDCLCTPPSNDECVGASPIAVGGSRSDELATATSDAAFDTCDNVVPGVGRWHRVDGNGNTLTASTCTSPFEFWDAAINVYCGTDCDDLVCVAGDDQDNCGPNNLHESVSWCSASGQTYWILVHSVSGQPSDGNYTLTIANGAACTNPVACDLVANDSCQNALPIGLGNTAFNTTGASTDGVPSAAGQCNDFGQPDTHNDIWYIYTATQSGALQVTTCAQLGGQANYDTDLVLYSMSAPGGNVCPPLDTARIACNDDDPNNPCGTAAPFASTLVGQVTAGQQYRLRVGGWGASDFGPGVVNLSLQNFACGNGNIEPGEQCDDPGPGCVNCQVVPVCGATCTATDPEPCLANEAVDNTNGGCNSTPAVFGSAIAGQTKCGTVSTYMVGTANRRDTDWQLYTVGASGNVRVDFRSAIPTVSFLITSGSVCPASGITGLGWSDDNTCAAYQVNNLTPGSQVVVFFGPGNPDGSGVFTGFPCGNPDGNNYSFTVTSPTG